jgi:hypothetical protein
VFVSVFRSYGECALYIMDFWLGKYADELKMARATSSLGSSEKHLNGSSEFITCSSVEALKWLERIHNLARANSVAPESDLRSALDLGREMFLKDWVKCGFTSEIPQRVVLTPYPCNEGLGRLNPLV